MNEMEVEDQQAITLIYEFLILTGRLLLEEER